MLLEFSSCAPHKCSVPAVARLYTNTTTRVADGPIVPVTEKRCQFDVIENVVLTITAPAWSSIKRLADSLSGRSVLPSQLGSKSQHPQLCRHLDPSLHLPSRLRCQRPRILHYQTARSTKAGFPRPRRKPPSIFRAVRFST